eukprot:COSAG01_NODE_1036_length_11988_cov_10.055345_9_plen_326_part_00
MLDMLDKEELDSPHIQKMIEFVRTKVGVPFQHYESWLTGEKQLRVPSWLLQREHDRLKLLLRPQLEPMLKAEGLAWADTLPAIDDESFCSVDDLRVAIADPPAFARRLFSATGAAGIAIAVARLRISLEPHVREQGMGWKQAVPTLELFSIDELKTALHDSATFFYDRVLAKLDTATSSQQLDQEGPAAEAGVSDDDDRSSQHATATQPPRPRGEDKDQLTAPADPVTVSSAPGPAPALPVGDTQREGSPARRRQQQQQQSSSRRPFLGTGSVAARAEASLQMAISLASKNVGKRKKSQRPGHRPNPNDVLFEADADLRDIFQAD